jgi:hypothetical protein
MDLVSIPSTAKEQTALPLFPAIINFPGSPGFFLSAQNYDFMFFILIEGLLFT